MVRFVDEASSLEYHFLLDVKSDIRRFSNLLDVCQVIMYPSSPLNKLPKLLYQISYATVLRCHSLYHLHSSSIATVFGYLLYTSSKIMRLLRSQTCVGMILSWTYKASLSQLPSSLPSPLQYDCIPLCRLRIDHPEVESENA